ncbi:MAG TPA: hypothetical protein VGR35_13760 [Tepidisphaeraceae bacterium]|nr:hypothetical protein [Tepidisphaeraceae bacterium]
MFTCCGEALAHEFFKITVVDEQTKRGVPLVELRTTNEIRFVTDSNGIVAFNEPGLMDEDVYFSISSHGYTFPRDGFGNRGKTLHTKPGGEATIPIQRINLAQRLYRITGQGIYADSVLTDTPVPTSQPVLNGKVMGQDSVSCVPYQGRLFWLWGDTGKQSYPLGNYRTTCATSPLPGPGVLDPSHGVNLTYFVGDDGFAKPMVPLEEEGMVWLDGLFTLTDEHGRERLIARYLRLKDMSTLYEVGLVVFNDEKAQFKRLVKWDLDSPLRDGFGHAIRHSTDGVDYVYFAMPFPTLRVRADLAHVKDAAAYETFTPLAPGARFDKADLKLDRDAGGKLIYGWKRDTGRIGHAEQRELIKAGALREDEAFAPLRDVETGKPIVAHTGSCFYNTFRKQWVMVFTEIFGASAVGEVWYAEATQPLGPWTAARKIVTHDDYSFYNPKHHPYFDSHDGQFIYFEGTYTRAFSGNRDPTPRYDYNQIMYRLDLSDPRLYMNRAGSKTP